MNRSELFFSVREGIDDELSAIIASGDVQRISFLREEIASKPRYPDLRYQLAYLLYLRAEYDDAVRELDVATQLNPRFVDALRLRGTILTSQGKLVDARAIYEQILEYSPADAESHYRLAVVHGRLGRHEESVASARQAIEHNRNHELAHVFLAERYLFEESWDDSIRHYESANLLHPNEEHSYILGLLYLKVENEAKAETHFEQALRLKPHHLNSCVRLAVLKVAQGDYERAQQLLRTALNFYPRYPDLQYSLAKVCLLMGRRDEAYELMKSALEINPRYAEVRREMGYLYSIRHMNNEAVAELRQSLDIDPNDQQSYLNLGFVYSNQGAHERAVEVLEQAVRRFPDSWRMYHSLGIIHLQEKAFPKAKQAFALAIRINPELEAVQRGLRIAFQDESLLEEERERLMHRFPRPEDVPELDFHLGQIHLDFHKEKIAIGYLQRSLSAGYEPVINSLLLGTAYGNLQNFDLGIRTLQAIQTDGMTEILRRVLLGLFHANAGDYPQSSRFYQQVISDTPLFFRALDGIGISLREREEIDDMLDDYLDYARFHERNCDLFCRIGQLYTQKGMLVEAKQHFHHATVLDPTRGQGYFGLGILALFRCNYKMAVDLLLRAVEKEVEWALPHLQLGLIHFHLGKHRLAAVSLRRYINLEKDEQWREVATKLLQRSHDNAPAEMTDRVIGIAGATVA